MKRVYLDYSATTPLADKVFDAMKFHFLGNYGNASSVHDFGRKARAALEESREVISRCIGARHDELFFTSGGTEADNHAVKGIAHAARKQGRNHLLVSSVEHHAVLHPALSLRDEGFDVDVVKVDRYGVVDLDELGRLMRGSTALVSVMHANNEVGTLEPIRRVAEIAHLSGAVVHTDAVQSFGKVPVNVEELGVDLMSLSAHKIYGPKGIGAIFIRKGTRIDSLIGGGGQEQNRRSGTENVPLAVGFAKAAELSLEMMENESKRVRLLKSDLRKKLESRFDGLHANGHPTDALPHILNVSFDSQATDVDGEALIIGMDLRGVAVTSGSACTSGTLEASHVLMAMGKDEKTARGAIRFSIGRPTTAEDLEFACEALEAVLGQMHKKSP